MKKMIRSALLVSIFIPLLAATSVAPIRPLISGTEPTTTQQKTLKQKPENDVSPARRLVRSGRPERREIASKAEAAANSAAANEVRSYDGSGNNRRYPQIGATFEHLIRLVPSDYADGYQALAGVTRKSARDISNRVMAQERSRPNADYLSDFFWQWGQFVDHDFGLTEGVDPPEPANILVPTGDPLFDPQSKGTAEISFNRSIYDINTGTDPNNPREQENEISGWIDASNVYGSSLERATSLRTLDGTGRLKVSDGNMLPFNEGEAGNAGDLGMAGFFAGDVRANENVGLLSMHTLFVREHNRLVAQYKRQFPKLNGDELYQKARAYVGALMQVITYREFVPLLLGRNALPRYSGYKRGVNANLANSFTTAAFRFGHSALSPQLLRLDANLEPIDAGHLALRDAFFSPHMLIEGGGLEPLLRGLANQVSQQVDNFVIDDVRNFLFGQPGAGGFDLVALNIQRGRDHGLPGLNQMRKGLGLLPYRNFRQLSSDPEIVARLQSAYSRIDDVDLWVGGLSEDRVRGAQVGETFRTIMIDQFTALRDGDRFWYGRQYRGKELRALRHTKLSDIIKRNTEIQNEIPRNVFKVRGRWRRNQLQ